MQNAAGGRTGQMFASSMFPSSVKAAIKIELCASVSRLLLQKIFCLLLRYLQFDGKIRLDAHECTPEKYPPSCPLMRLRGENKCRGRVENGESIANQLSSSYLHQLHSQPLRSCSVVSLFSLPDFGRVKNDSS